MPGYEMSEFVWHYTTVRCLGMIRASGFIFPATVRIEPQEKPVVWFSANQEWEPTATKLYVGSDGETRAATRQEMIEADGGLARLGIPPDQAVPWWKIKKTAKIPNRVWRGLIISAKQDGASAKDWCAVVGSLPLNKISAIEVMDENGVWERIQE